MDCFLPLLSFLLLSAAACHAALPAQVYWRTVIPNTPMPSTIRDLLRPVVLADEKTNVNVGKSGVDVNARVSYNYNSASTEAQIHEDPNVARVSYNYNSASTKAHIHEDPNVALFFLEKKLTSGSKMRLKFPRAASGSGAAAFLPRREADSIPFSSEKLPEILKKLSVEPGSSEAEEMKQTLQECEEPALEGENKYCATSLESMVDFSTSSLGTRHVRAVSTEAGKDGAKEQEFTVGPAKRLAGSELVACHREAYAYPVFYCHTTRATRAYMVKLAGAADGAAVEAVAVCHLDTAGWNPGYVALKVLKVKPGTVPVCHFLPQDHIVWTRGKVDSV